MDTRDEGLTLLMKAVIKNKKETLLFLLDDPDQRKLIDLKNFEGKTALFLAIFYGYHDMLKLLLKAGANPNVQNDFGWTPLMQARFQRNFAAIDILLLYKADTSIRNYNNQTIYEMNFSDNPFITPIVFNKTITLKNLLLRSTPKNFDYLLKLALRLKKHACLENLLEQKPDLNKDNYLEMALFNDDFNSFEIFLRNGANPNIPDNLGNYLLHTAVFMRKHRYVLMLLEYNADVNVADKLGETPLMLAIKLNDAVSIKAIAEKKPNLSFENQLGESALSLIEKQEWLEEKVSQPNVLKNPPHSFFNRHSLGVAGGALCVASFLAYQWFRRGR